MKQIYTRHIQHNYQPKHPGRNSSETFALGFEPPEELGSEYGDLYICFESHPDDKRLNPDNIIQGCGKAFYESGLETEFEKRFKLCLRALNELIVEAKTSCNISLVAVQHGNLIFSNVGSGLMRLVRYGSSTNLASDKRHERFSEIGQGKLSAGDKIILASQAITSSFTPKEISKTLTDYPLEDIESLIVAKLEVPKDLAVSFVVVGSESLSTETHEQQTTDSKTKPILSDKAASFGKLSQYINTLRSSIQQKSKKASSKVQESAKSASSKIGPSVSSRTKHGWTSIWAKYINPNPKQAIIVVVITILIVVAVIWGGSALINGGNIATQQFEQAISLIESSQTNLNKGNKTAAQEGINKANSILKSISTSDQEEINQLANQKKLKLDFAAALKQSQMIEDSISNTTRLSLDSGFAIPQAKLSSLIWSDGVLYGIDPADGSIIEINPLLGAPLNKGSNADLIDSSAAQSLNGGGLVAIGKTGVWQYTAPGGLAQLKASNLPQGVDVASYLNNIYILSPSENQVIRYSKSGTNLSNRTGLLKNLSSGSLSSATSLTVSGNVFIAQNKEIKLFEQGSERSYKISNMPEGFGEFNKLFHNPEQGYFLISNKAGTRLALLTTESDSAKFVKQYAVTNDSPIQAFTVEPANSQLILSSGNKIITNKIEK